MKFDSSFLGAQEITVAEQQQPRSTYRQIHDAMFRNAYYLKWGGKGQPGLPVYEVTLGRVLRGILPGGLPWLFKGAAARTLDSTADLRWGPDGKGFRRLLHPNGICLFGEWIIDQPNPYSGYFAAGKNGLIVGRYSTCCTETRRGHNRSLSLVGKIFPTTDPDHSELLESANFITQEDLGGEKTRFINDAILRNAPDTTPWRRGLGLPILLLTGLAFLRVDREPTIRQLYPIAELGKPKHTPTRAPKFMQLVVDQAQPRIEGVELDFRDEILAQLEGDEQSPQPRKIIFHIEVTDHGSTRGKLIQRRTFDQGWNRIGRIEFSEAVASYNSDFVLHFHHPRWRVDRNDPDSVVRPTKSPKG